MIAKEHIYNVTVRWTGNNGTGTSDYRSYTRNHIISARNKPDISASSDPVFRGDGTKYNPEELLLASVSGCHMLWFLHFCADSGVVVVDYIDNPIGIMIETANGSGKFKEITLQPVVTVHGELSPDRMEALHQKAHEHCFIANSLNFPVKHRATLKTDDQINI